MALLNGPAMVRAIGEPGEPGDPDRIQHLARRMASTYVELMDWSARLRGANRPDGYRRIFDIVAAYADQPIAEYRAWVADLVEKVRPNPGYLAAGTQPETPMNVTLTLTISPEVMAEFEAEIAVLEAGPPEWDPE